MLSPPAVIRLPLLEGSPKVRTAEGYVVDLYVETSGGRRNLYIEIDGPSRFVGWSRVCTGATLLKRRQLRSFGTPLVTVPYWEWEVPRRRSNLAGRGCAGETVLRS